VSLLGLRLITLRRGFGVYWRWVGRAIGWASVVYFALWGVFLLTSGLQILLERLPRLNIAPTQPFLPWVLALMWVMGVYLPRIPPVLLSQREVLRLGLAPLLPFQVLAWGFVRQGLMAVGSGLIWGGLSALFAPRVLGMALPIAPVWLTLWLLAGLAWRWLNYAGQDAFWAGVIVVLLAALETIFNTPFLTGDVSFLPPLFLGLFGWHRVYQMPHYPRDFFWHSQILAELQALQVQAMLTSSRPDPDTIARRRKLLFLHQTKQKTPFVPPPSWGVFGAVLWRGVLLFWRRSLMAWLGLAIWLGLLTVFHAPQLANGFVWLWLWQAVLPQLLPALHDPRLPIPALTRTTARIMPSAIGCTLLAIGAMVALPAFATTVVILWLRAICGLALLEKISVWLVQNPSSREAGYSAAALCLLPGLLSGMGVLEPLTQLLLLVLALWAVRV
jgi:hypothetical protein